jgi:CBS domain-containing protein
VSVRPGTSAEAAARLMSRLGIHRLLVLDDGRLVGVLSAMDLVRAVAEHRV